MLPKCIGLSAGKALFLVADCRHHQCAEKRRKAAAYLPESRESFGRDPHHEILAATPKSWIAADHPVLRPPGLKNERIRVVSEPSRPIEAQLSRPMGGRHKR